MRATWARCLRSLDSSREILVFLCARAFSISFSLCNDCRSVPSLHVHRSQSSANNAVSSSAESCCDIHASRRPPRRVLPGHCARGSLNPEYSAIRPSSVRASAVRMGLLSLLEWGGTATLSAAGTARQATVLLRRSYKLCKRAVGQNPCLGV